MSNVISIPNDTLKFTDADGTTIVEAPALELHYVCMLAIGDIQDKKGRGEAVAAALKEEYKLDNDISWSVALHITMEVQKILGEEKKSQ